MASGQSGSPANHADGTHHAFQITDERARRVLASVDTAGRGLEIGPSYNPLLPKRSGANIRVIDHASRDELAAKYAALGVAPSQLDQIEEVDYVSGGRGLLDTIGPDTAFDYIIGSNVIEHLVDLIEFLQDCERLLTPSGRLSMSVPDQRYCFDLLRPFSTAGDVVEAHLNPSPFHSAGSLVESTTFSCTRDGMEAWAEGMAGGLALHVPAGLIPRLVDQWLNQTEYNDAHRWVFTPSSFMLLVQDLRELGYHHLVQLESEPALGHEFYVTLAHGEGSVVRHDRLELLQSIRAELAQAAEDDHLGPRANELAGRLADARTEVEALQGQLQAQREDAAQLAATLQSERADLESVLTSKSWRLTAPLRRIGSLIRR